MLMYMFILEKLFVLQLQLFVLQLMFYGKVNIIALVM